MTLLLLLVITAIVGLYYHHHQNARTAIGGKISKPKSFWLFFALFHYYIFPTLLLIQVDVQTPGYGGLVLCFGFLLLRAIIQMALMFGSKNWTPTIGLAFNFTLSAAAIYSMAKILLTKPEWQQQPMLLLYLLLLLCIAIADSYYAQQFHKLVGTKTMGKDAIWFAPPDDPAFAKINRITFRNNFLLSLFSFLIIILFYHGLPQPQ
jgi:uncharacterized protein (UPF0333 family)